MKKASLLLVALFAAALLSSKSVQAQGKFDGYMINEYYSVLSHHNEDFKGNHGFWFRRIYLTYNTDITDGIKMRLRYEMNSPGDFRTSSSLNPLVKDAYLSFKLGAQSMKVGIQSPPTFDTIEGIWGYRALEKTPLDLLKLRSSRDFGISMKGNLDPAKKATYIIMYGNGSSNKAETNQGKVFYGFLSFQLTDGLYAEVYGDYESQPDDKNYYVYQGFASYSGEWGRFGLQLSNKHYSHNDTSLDYTVLSVFTVIKAGEKTDIIARYDRNFGDGFKESFKGSGISYVPFANNVESNFGIAALSFQIWRNIKIIPNLKYTFYNDSDKGEKPESDIYANLTLYYQF